MFSDQTEELTVATFEGALGIYERPLFEKALPPANYAGRIVLDFARVTSIDSTILAALMLYRQRRIIAGGNPLEVIAIVNPRLHRLFEITGIVRAITVLPLEAREEFVQD